MSSVEERALRERLGIPADAEQVLVVSESSHWDPDWLLTSPEYFRLLVRRNLSRAVAELLAEPRRVYGVECAFFMRMYLDAVPERRDAVRDLVNAGRLRLMGSAVTTPDTLLPSTEALIRDFLIGQDFYRANGMVVEPRTAYFPDSFGHSPALPSILDALGVTGAGICRIDGQYMIGRETDSRRHFPRPGTSAELLMKEHKTQDFVWRGPDGAEVLTHWLAYGYGYGEMFAHAGLTRVAGAPLALPWRKPDHIAKRVARYTRRLGRLARTPYLLCPIGPDFERPIPHLVDLIDRYNDVQYPATGTWLVNAGFDDYLALVSCHRDGLPVIELDPNPYFSGFYGSRPSVKRRCAELVDGLLDVEALVLATGDPEEIARVTSELARPWWIAATSNHHDYVTGTSPDRVVAKEQLPWLEEGLRTVRDVASRLAAQTGTSQHTGIAPSRRRGRRARIAVERHGNVVELSGAFGRMRVDGDAGGAVTELLDPDGRALLGPGPGFDVVGYADSGGLWRMGFEYPGGTFEPRSRASDHPARIEVHAIGDADTIAGFGDGVEISLEGSLEGVALLRRLRVWAGASGSYPLLIAVRTQYRVPENRTITLRVPVVEQPDSAVMDCPGGVVTRPARKRYDPTFWPVQSFAHVPAAGGTGVAVLLAAPGAVALGSEPPDVQVLLMRNATMERFRSVVPVPGIPVRGRDPGPHSVDVALVPTGGAVAQEGGLAGLAAVFARSSRATAAGVPPVAILSLDRQDVSVVAAKPAHRGEGVIVRLAAHAGEAVPVELRWAGRPLRAAFECDALERDRAALEVRGNAVSLIVERAIATVRLIPVGV